jgi:Fe-S-cluster containining protein
MSSSNGNGAGPASNRLDESFGRLERQIERSSIFNHATMEAVSNRLFRAESLLSELLEVLRPMLGETDPSPGPAMEPEREAVDESDEEDSKAIAWPGIALWVDPVEEAAEPAREVNCAERMHICHAVCCKLNFALAPKEVEGGKVKWDLGHPYMVRHEADGMCTHNNRETGFCGIYEDRPRLCGRYSCANDNRIWKDFDGMVLNQEWIDENLANQGRIVFLGPIGSRPRMIEEQSE